MPVYCIAPAGFSSCVRREDAPPEMDERDHRRVERERRRSSLAKGKDRRSSKAGKQDESWACANRDRQTTPTCNADDML